MPNAFKIWVRARQLPNYIVCVEIPSLLKWKTTQVPVLRSPSQSICWRVHRIRSLWLGKDVLQGHNEKKIRCQVSFEYNSYSGRLASFS